MATAPFAAALTSYAQRLREALRANPNTPETGLAPLFQQLVADLLPLLPATPPLVVSPEYHNPGVGRPDIALIVQGQPPRAFIELKAPAKSANPEQWGDAHDRRQFGRLKELSIWATSNFADFHLFARDEALGSAAIVPPHALRPDTPDAAAAALIATHDAQPFLDLLATLVRADAPTARNAEHLAELMAHSARLVRSAVQERLGVLHAEGVQNHPLLMVRNTFRNVLYAHPEAGGYPAGDFDALFSSAFAQTLAFGLLLVREATNADVGPDAWRDMPDEHPLMQAALRVLSEDEVQREIGIGFTVMCDTVNSFAPEILTLQPNGRDPILYFYEDFLSIFDPAARERYGVYYTPIEVVRYMAGALDRALRDNLGTQGLRDPAVTILDPATGTGTFLLGVAERVRAQVMAEEGGIAASMALAELAGRMFGFELLVGPYAVAHYRLHHALRFRPPDDGEDAPQPVNLPRLGVYLADTLAAPGVAAGELGIPGIPIAEERAAANRIKSEHPILAIIGNPPYKRLVGNERETLVGRWVAGGQDEGGNAITGLWDDLKRPVSEAGHGNQLNTFEEFSVAFWRWSIWKLFEADNAPGRGVIAFITNRKFLTGWPYAGLRKMMREKFDRIEIIDLRGDVRAGPRGDVGGDQGVFNIMVGTAITVAIADGSKAEDAMADVQYLDCWEDGLFARRAKLDWLVGGAPNGDLPDRVKIDRGTLDDFRPAPFQNGDWLSIREAFAFYKSGMKSGDNSSFVSIERSALPDNVATKLANRADPNYDASKERLYAFRLLDRRWLYNDLRLLQRPGPALQSAWGDHNFGIQALKSSTSVGPAAWCNSLLPDYDCFNARGGYAFPLYDKRIGPNASNLNPVLIAALSEAYGQAQSSEDIFDAILALLSATSYTILHAEDLEDVFPHIPFPADPAVFAEAVRIGAEIRALEAFQREPAAEYRPLAFCRIVGQPDAETVIGDIAYADGVLSLWKNGNQAVPAFSGLPEAVWSFSVSGYRVLPRWIDGRKGLPVTLALMRELRDIAARIAELLHWFDTADLVLHATLADTLTRAELGFPAAQPKEAEDGDD